MSNDDWREERLRARRQQEAEEAAAEEAAAIARAAPPPTVRAPRPARPPRPRSPSPSFGRTTTRQASSSMTAFGLTLPSLNILQISLIALGLVFVISLIVVRLTSHHAAGDPAQSSAQQQAAVDQSGAADEPVEAPRPLALRPSLPVASPSIATTGPQNSGAPGAATGDQPQITTPARWIGKPSDEEIAAAFPDEARDSDAEGRAVVQCVISAGGEPSGCTVQSETPAGDGFGKAALGLARKFKFKAKTVSGAPVDGGVATISIRFAR
jgi:TonB family protein